MAHSIAAALPMIPKHGLRVIVASRLNPGLPDDVDELHPLKLPEIVRSLRPSVAAKDIAEYAKNELNRLLHGSEMNLDLVGFLTAAVGGLTAEDLARPTHAAPWEIEEALHGVAGRTLASRPSRWAPQDRAPAYLLGHEELQNQAGKALGNSRLQAYRGLLHQWAEGYLHASGRRTPPSTSSADTTDLSHDP